MTPYEEQRLKEDRENERYDRAFREALDRSRALASLAFQSTLNETVIKESLRKSGILL